MKRVSWILAAITLIAIIFPIDSRLSAATETELKEYLKVQRSGEWQAYLPPPYNSCQRETWSATLRIEEETNGKIKVFYHQGICERLQIPDEIFSPHGEIKMNGEGRAALFFVISNPRWNPSDFTLEFFLNDKGELEGKNHQKITRSIIMR